MNRRTVLPYGERAVLIEVADHHAALALYEHVRAAPPPGVVDLVPAARTLLVVCSDAGAARGAAADIAARDVPATGAPRGDALQIPVVYDGPDLDAVAELAGLSVEQVVDLHLRGSYEVAFVGFAPGFGYLGGLHPSLHVPRLPDPRTRVPAGAVAIAGGFSAVYPGASPGGWRLIGRTALPMWDLTRRPPALLTPGRAVRFVPA